MELSLNSTSLLVAGQKLWPDLKLRWSLVYNFLAQQLNSTTTFVTQHHLTAKKFFQPDKMHTVEGARYVEHSYDPILSIILILAFLAFPRQIRLSSCRRRL